MPKEYSKYDENDLGPNLSLITDYELYHNTSGWESGRCTLPKTEGKHYAEIEMTNGETYIALGVGRSDSTLTSYVGRGNSWGWIDQVGAVRHNNSNVASSMVAVAGDFIGMAVDLDNNKLWFSKNGSWAWGTAAGDPSLGTGGIDISSRGTDALYIMSSLYYSHIRCVLYTGYQEFEYPAPAGFRDGWYIETYFGYYNGYTMLQGDPVSRVVRLYDEDTGTLQDETTSSGNGYYSLETTVSGAHYTVCLDDTDNYNHLINKAVLSSEIV